MTLFVTSATALLGEMWHRHSVNRHWIEAGEMSRIRPIAKRQNRFRVR